MEYVIAIAHILGSVIALIAMSIGLVSVESWSEKKELKAATEDAALSLGIPLMDLDNIKHTDAIVEHYQCKYTSERFTNRVADSIGVILSIWGWLGVVAKICFLGFIVFIVIGHSLDSAIYAWMNLVIYLVFYISGFVVAVVTKVVLGRYPSEPKRSRVLLSDYIERQRERVRREEVVKEFNSNLVK